jgi:rubrerythrin
MEWGKEIINEEIKYYWRCSWCGYRGEDIIEV